MHINDLSISDTTIGFDLGLYLCGRLANRYFVNTNYMRTFGSVLFSDNTSVCYMYYSVGSYNRSVSLGSLR